MSIATQIYSVIPLSIQDEGDCFMVGNQDLGDFYQLPKEGVAIIGMLRNGDTVDTIKAQAARDFADELDVDDFIATMIEIGFVAAVGQPVSAAAPTANFHDADRRIRFNMGQQTARLFISLPVITLYAGVLACAAWAMVVDARARPNLQAFYLEQNLTLTALCLLFLQTGTTILHECGHMIAAASQGVNSRLGIGNRMWNIVAEADLTGIFSLPKRRRYFPLLAGMMVDLFSISVITLLVWQLSRNAATPAVVAMLQALLLQIFVTLSWQFNLFLRTDIYYVLCNLVSYPTLDTDARIYIADKLHSFSFGMAGRPAHTHAFHRADVVRLFAAIWLAGRIAGIGFLFAILLPTLFHYLTDAYHAVTHTGTSKLQAWDVIAFACLSVSVTGTGLFIWITNKFKSRPGAHP